MKYCPRLAGLQCVGNGSIRHEIFEKSQTTEVRGILTRVMTRANTDALFQTPGVLVLDAQLRSRAVIKQALRGCGEVLELDLRLKQKGDYVTT